MAATLRGKELKPRRTERLPAKLFLVLALLGSSGCARPGAEAEAPSESRAEIALVVENHHWSDVIVYLLHDGVVERIGLATAVKTSTFIIPSRRLGIAGLIRLRGHPVGAPDDHTTDAFLVRPGQEIEWTLESDLARSSVAVH
jgi:hypothetical protein